MKLKKDEFKRADIESSGLKIINMLIDYVEQNKLRATTHSHSTTLISIADTPQNSQIINFRRYIESNFNFLNENYTQSHSISLPYNHKVKFYSSALKKLNDFEKIVLIKSMFEQRPSFKDLNPDKGIISPDDFWLHLRHIAPFSKIKQKQHSEDVRTIIDALSNKSLDTQEKVYSLAYFLNYYKTIARRTDIKAGLVRVLKNKIDTSYFPIFEGILDVQFIIDISSIDIFTPAPEVKSLIIQKDVLLNQIHFSNIPQAQTNDYNNYLKEINSFLLSSEIKEKLNIVRVDFHELSSTKEPSRVYIHAGEDGFKADIEQLYRHLIQTCPGSFKTPILRDSLEKSFNYFILNQSITQKNSENEEPTRKVTKL